MWLNIVIHRAWTIHDMEVILKYDKLWFKVLMLWRSCFTDSLSMTTHLCLLQKISGGRHSNVIVGELRSDCAKYEEGLVKAAQSNEELHRAMEVHIANLRVLSQPLSELQKSLPSPADIHRCM